MDSVRTFFICGVRYRAGISSCEGEWSPEVKNWIRTDHLSVWRCTTISNLMINEQIRDKEVRLIGPDGEQLGIMSAREAMAKARGGRLDLVKIAPTGKAAGM